MNKICKFAGVEKNEKNKTNVDGKKVKELL